MVSSLSPHNSKYLRRTKSQWHKKQVEIYGFPLRLRYFVLPLFLIALTYSVFSTKQETASGILVSENRITRPPPPSQIFNDTNFADINDISNEDKILHMASLDMQNAFQTDVPPPASISAIAEQLANIEPASGDATNNSPIGSLTTLPPTKVELTKIMRTRLPSSLDTDTKPKVKPVLKPETKPKTTIAYKGFIPKPKPVLAKKFNFSPQTIISSITGTEKRRLTVKSGDTITSLLVKKGGIDYGTAYRAITAMGPVYSPQDLRTSHNITAIFKRQKGQKVFTGLTIEKDPIKTIIVKRQPNGDFTAGAYEKNTYRKTVGKKARIDSSLYMTANKQNIPDAVTLSLIHILSWNIDFQRDIRSGDELEIIYDEYTTEDGKRISNKSKILYANLRLSGRDITVYRYEDAKGNINYFDANGRSVRKALMTTPINGARLSSGFGRRKHPVLGYTKMHKGLDFAAPRGTPIYAAGDGVIEHAGRKGSYGNYVRIRHRHGLKTAYAHLKGFKRGVRTGKRVKQGDVIAYVGTTGRSTGPHLHYEVLMNGRQVNPKRVKTPRGVKLKGTNLANFQSVVTRVNKQFDKFGFRTALAQR